ncbi:MAG: hypothetical protein PVJ57_06345 [Phycisphaerae bacterium]
MKRTSKKRTTKATTRRSRTTRASTPSLAMTMSKAAARRLAFASLWLIALAGAVYGLHRLEPYALAANTKGPWTLSWINPPADSAWMLKEIEDERLTATFRQTDIHDPNLCERIKDALEQSAWIEKVERVAKRSDGVVNVTAVFRRYVSFVVKDGMGYLVDAQGTRLPRQVPASSLGEYGLLLIEGASGPVPSVGQAWSCKPFSKRSWSGTDVQAGLALVTFLREKCPPELLGLLVAVDVSNCDDRLNGLDGWLSVRTIYPGMWIRWGLPPGKEYGIEATSNTKFEHLWSAYRNGSQFHERSLIDVRPRKGIIVPSTP